MGDVSTITIGVDIGQKSDPSAVVVAEQLLGDRHRLHRIERIALQTAYPQVADRLATIYAAVVDRQLERLYNANLRKHGALPGLSGSATELEHTARRSVYVMVDATGCGLPVVDFLRESARIDDGHLAGVMFTAGSGCNVRRGAKEGSVSKSYLVSRLQSLMGFGRLEWPRTAAARELADELSTFELTISDNATPQWNARAGHHDDLVCAAGLAVLIGADAYRSGSVRYA